MRIVHVALFLIAVAGCAKTKSEAPAPGSATGSVDTSLAALPPCRRHLACLDRCVDTVPERRDPAGVRRCTEACEKAADEESLAAVRGLRACEYDHCSNITAGADDTPATIRAKQVACSRKLCDPQRRRCGVTEDEF